MNNSHEHISGVDTAAYEIGGWAHHPNTGDHGVLVRHRSTGRYSLALGSTLKSVPQGWAGSEWGRVAASAEG